MKQAHNNLQTFRIQVKTFLINANNLQNTEQNNNLSILTYEQFKDLTNHLCNQKLLHPSEVKKLISKVQPSEILMHESINKKNSSKPSQKESSFIKQQQVKSKKKIVSFPLPIKQFENIIKTEFADQNCKNLMRDLTNFQTLLKQIKGAINVWKDKGLTNQQKSQLQSIFAKGNQKIKHFCQELKNKKQILESISQQQIQMIKSLDEWVQMQKISKKFVDYKDFQRHNREIINSLFTKNQVKQVHFKKKDAGIKISSDVSIVKGFNSKNDEPLEVVLISKTSINFSKINKELIKFDALNELSLSEYFPKFFGFNTHSSPTCIQYYVQTFQTKNLNDLIKSQNGLDIDSPLLKYWMYQIYKAFYDIFLMCSYQPEIPIKLSDFQVKDFGLQILLRNIKFSQKRKPLDPKNRKIDYLQTLLIHNLGLVLLQLLKISPEFNEIDKKLSKLQQKCFFKGLLNIKQGHKNFQNSIIENYLSFFNMSTHPLLQESQFSDGVQIIQNYVAIFQNQ